MGMHCQLPEYNCRTREVWTEEKRNWCCAREGLGCVKYNCRTRELWTEEKKKWCCANEDLGCDNNQTQPCDNWEWPPKDIKFCASNSECENFEVCEGCMSGLCTCSNGQPDRCTMDCRCIANSQNTIAEVRNYGQKKRKNGVVLMRVLAAK